MRGGVGKGMEENGDKGVNDKTEGEDNVWYTLVLVAQITKYFSSMTYMNSIPLTCVDFNGR